MKNIKLVAGCLAFPLGLSMLICNEAFAQEQSRPTTTILEEMLVTARKREESIQTVPIAVTSLSGELIENGNVLNLREIAKFSPNVELIAQPFAGNALSASIRGLSFDDLEKSFEPTVGVSVDGIFLGTSAGANVDLFDVESVEVLRGPQGTLYGRNTIGGTVNIRRTRPTGEFGVKAQVGLGRYNMQDLKAVVNVPIVEDVLAAKFSVRSLESDTFQYNVTRGEDVKGRDLLSGSATFLLTPSDDLEALLTIDVYDDDSRPPEPVNLSNDGDFFCTAAADELGCASTSGDLSEAEDYTLSFAPIPFISTIDGHNVGLEINKNIGDYTITSVTGIQDFDEFLDEENTGAPIELARAVRDGTYDQFSQELRLTSNLDGNLNFVTGLYYFNSNYTLDQVFTVFGAVTANDFFSEQDIDAYSAFGELTYQLTDTVRLTAGGRYTDETKDFDHVSDVQAAGPFSFQGEESWSEFTHRLGLDYTWDEGKMAYINWSTGFRSGGWNGRPASLSEVGPYEPETLDNYEIGIRTDWLDSRLRVNLTGFDMSINDKQEQFVIASPIDGSPITVVENAAEASYQGLELEVFAVPSDQHDMNIRLAIGLLDAEYDSYIREGVDVADQAELVYAPDMTASIGGDYSHSVGRGEVNYQLNWKWTDDSRGRSEVPPDPAGRDIIDSYSALDISANYRAPLSGDSVLTVTAYCNDILNDGARIARPFEARGTFTWGTPEARRLYGLKVGVEF